MRVFLDANVLFSAAKTEGAVRRLLRELLARGHECWADDYVVAEARWNRIEKGPEALQVLEALLAQLSLAPAAPPAAANADVSWLPSDDQPVLASAILLKCEALETGDRTHFGIGYGRAFGGVVIHSRRSLAEALLGT